MIPRSSNPRLAIVVGAGLLSLACAPQAPPPAERPAASECRVAGSGSGAGRRLTVGVAHPVVAAHAPEPANPAEALLFPLLYGSLVRIDCTGELRAGLAISWRSSDDDRLWEFRLDSTARFWDGSPVTAGDVAAGLLERAPSGIAVVGVRDAMTVSVRFTRPQASGPLALADPALAVVRTGSGAWPLGTGRHRIDPERERRPGARGERALTIVPADGRMPELRFLIRPGGDERDILDEGADLLVTRDADVMEYVRQRTGHAATALPWDRTYVLVAPGRARAPALGDFGSMEALPVELREQLALDAVKGTARPHTGAVAGGPGHCEMSEDRAGLPPPVLNPLPNQLAPRVLYDADDPTARQLAGRIVALAIRAGTPGSDDAFSGALAAAVPGLRAVGSLRAMGLPTGELERELRLGSAVIYVLAAPLRTVESCDWLEWAGRRAPWLGADPASFSAVIPLVDTRPHLVAREGLPAVYVDGAGTLRFEPAVPQRRER